MSYEILEELAMDRSKGIGGSDVAAIVGLNPYKTPYDLWLEKTKRVEPGPDNPRMKMGRRLESLVLDLTSESIGEIITGAREFVHKDRPWQVVHADGLITPKETIVEAKTTGERHAYRWGDPGTDAIPAEYLAQVAWYMSAYDWDKAVVGVLIGGQDFRVYNVSRDKELEAYLLTKAEKFWFVNVKEDAPPPLEASATVDRYIKERFPRDDSEIRVASQEESLLLKGYGECRKAYDAAERVKDRYEAEIKLAIGESAGLEFEGGKVTWRKAKDSMKVDWQSIAEAMGPISKQLLNRFSEIRPGSRRFLPSLK